MLFRRPIGLLLLSLLAFAWADEQQQQLNSLDHDRHHATVENIDDIVHGLAEESVKAALHDHLAPKYREGVFEGGQKAIESIQHENPELATKVIDAALGLEGKTELKKRQNSNSTASSTPIAAPSSSTTTTTSSTSSSPPPPPPPSSTPQVVTSSSSSTTSSSTTSTPISTPRPVVTSTLTKGETIVYTYTPTTKAITTAITRTTKLPDGSTQTHTTWKVVPASPTVPSIRPQGEGHTGYPGKPNLQTGDAARTGGYAGELAALFGVALGVAAMI